jgi:hypothetical protein
VSSAESAVESLLHSALADAHQAAVDVATAAAVLVADCVVTPTEYAGFGTEQPGSVALFWAAAHFFDNVRIDRSRTPRLAPSTRKRCR